MQEHPLEGVGASWVAEWNWGGVVGYSLPPRNGNWTHGRNNVVELPEKDDGSLEEFLGLAESR